MTDKNLLRAIPKVDEILKQREWRETVALYPQGIAKDALRLVLDELRSAIKKGVVHSIPSLASIIDATKTRINLSTAPGIKRVINGTGVIIHTNLGRSLLAQSAIEALHNAACHYTNLEYDLDKGERGDRYTHCTSILKRLTHAEGSLVVNNNAAAVYLVLNTLAEGKEVIISRGELIEIGGSFRIPDVMKKSGAILREVGTTNRTYREDYEKAIQDNTALLMKAHTSNYRIKGFFHEISADELIDLGKTYNKPIYFDTGSGLLIPLLEVSIHHEPSNIELIEKGIDIVSFSGDKLLGAPQAGIILGKAPYIEAMKKNPLARALRPDKFTLSALESTLLLYLDREQAIREIPTLRMILEDKNVLLKRARRIARKVSERLKRVTVSVIFTDAEVGGGTLPDVKIPSCGIALKPHTHSIESFEQKLRALPVPVIGRIEKDTLILDMRTIIAEDETPLIDGLETALKDDT
ncbi:MAG TPA: L-seryl-tRNA(Sec) selenium transferase [Deltaproteobacteria bacterium]|nr:L-seryl-tRNA(Sec) selenium transferase [Deltaproteobacteria bacterium]